MRLATRMTLGFAYICSVPDPHTWRICKGQSAYSVYMSAYSVFHVYPFQLCECMYLLSWVFRPCNSRILSVVRTVSVRREVGGMVVTQVQGERREL